MTRCTSAQLCTKPDIALRPHVRTTGLNLRRGSCHSDQYSSCVCVCTSARPHAKLHIASRPHAGGYSANPHGTEYHKPVTKPHGPVYHKPRARTDIVSSFIHGLQESTS
jgi:hypothetical protein